MPKSPSRSIPSGFMRSSLATSVGALPVRVNRRPRAKRRQALFAEKCALDLFTFLDVAALDVGLGKHAQDPAFAVDYGQVLRLELFEAIEHGTQIHVWCQCRILQLRTICK